MGIGTDGLIEKELAVVESVRGSDWYASSAYILLRILGTMDSDYVPPIFIWC